MLAGFLAFWTVAGSPKAYESTASVWVDSPPPLPTSLNETNPTVRTPAEQQQLLLGELLRTRGFRLTVGHKSPLQGYYAGNPSEGWGPTTLLGGGHRSPDARIVGALGPKQVTSIVAGPQVLQVTYQGPTPAVAAGTLRALLNQFSAERARLEVERNRSLVGFYQDQLRSARRALLEARATGTPGALRLATADYGRAQRRVQRASNAADAGTAHLGIAIIDPPRVPVGPVAGHKKTVMALVGGMFVGALISFLGVVALTPSRPGEWDEPTRLHLESDETDEERRRRRKVAGRREPLGAAAADHVRGAGLSPLAARRGDARRGAHHRAGRRHRDGSGPVLGMTTMAVGAPHNCRFPRTALLSAAPGAAIAFGLAAGSLVAGGHGTAVVGFAVVLVPVLLWKRPYLAPAVTLFAGITVEQFPNNLGPPRDADLQRAAVPRAGLAAPLGRRPLLAGVTMLVLVKRDDYATTARPPSQVTIALCALLIAVVIGYVWRITDSCASR